ncbi:MAG: membrane protein insertase YidC [Massilia sp.]
MDINKRTILWIVFAVSLVVLWNDWMVSKGGQSMFTVAPPAKVAKAPAAAGSAAATPAVATPGAPAAVGANGEPVAPFKPEIITITTDLIKADIDTAGGTVRRLELLKFQGTGHPGWFGGCWGLFKACKPDIDASKNEVLFDEGVDHAYLAQTGLIGAPNLPNHQSGFVAKPGPRSIDGNNDVQLVLESESGGVKLTKTFTFHRGSYVIDVRHDVSNVGQTPVAPSVYLQLYHDGNKAPDSSYFNTSFVGPTLYTPEEKYKKLDFATIQKNGHAEHPASSTGGWVAISQKFFVSAFIPQQNAVHDIVTRKEKDANRYSISTMTPLGTVAPGATVTNSARLYSGPQDEKVLEKVSPGLDLVKDYGMLTIIAKPIFWVMDHIHSVLGNWGWTIIVFTILIKLLFFPLSAAGFKSMAKVKKVTPKMQAIRERYKGDPAKMNQATMELYKTEKINPLGGCLPLVVQMPVFIALYWVLQATLEFRGAPWILWIQDLSQHDPWCVLPVLYAITMFVTAKLNPTPADPMQAKMMMFMPIAFSVIFFFSPSGLVLYMVVNSILSVAQQWFITKKYGEAPAK